MTKKLLNYKSVWFILLLSIFSSANALQPLESLGLGGGSGGDDGILDPEVAFKFSTEVSSPNSITARWDIAPDHYLYRDKVKLSIKDNTDVTLGEITLPAGDSKTDEFFGEIQVFHGQIETQLPLLRTTLAASTLTLHVEYQGCAEKLGICYPPIKKDIPLELPYATSLASSSTATPLSTAENYTNNDDNGDYLSQLESRGLIMSLLLLLGWGLIVAFTACMYPMIPILSSIIVGQGEKATFARSLTLSLVYVEGMALTFGVMGAVMGVIGDGIGIQAYFQSPWLLLPFAFIFILLALALFGLFHLQMPAALQSRIHEISHSQKSGSLIGVAIMGILSGLIIGPCGGPFLIASLGYAAASGDWFSGFLYLFVFGNGIGIPLLVVGASGGALLPKAGDWMNVVKAVGGVLLLGVVIVLLERMPHIFPPMITMIFWALLFIISAIFMGATQTLAADASAMNKFWKGLGTALLIYGVVVLLGGLTGASDVTHPLHGSRLSGSSIMGSNITTSNNKEDVHFEKIKSISDLEKVLKKAKTQGKPVMLDFYADWCTYCKDYEKYVFPDAQVQKELDKFILIQADVTAIDADDKALMKKVGVLLPPAILFFDTNSQEMHKLKIVGAMKADKFSDHLQKVLNKN